MSRKKKLVLKITKLDYDTVRRQLLKLQKDSRQQVWSMKITSEMRRDLMERGQSLFNVIPPVPLPRDEKRQTTRDLLMLPSH